MRKLVVGILAHVDAGKTTLSEALLYCGGRLKKLGRVDHQDAFLDTFALERSRGITIFSKQAVLPLETVEVTLLDTPGHVDFASEMERTLQVLDCAILVISGTDGVQGHTVTLWRLLKRYHIPTILFMNKMDLAGADHGALLSELRRRLDGGCVDFGGDRASFLEQVALCGEVALNQLLETGDISDDEISALVAQRAVFPCYFGSALKLEGVEDFLAGLERYAPQPVYGEAFGAKVFKIARDPQGNRLTYLKVTGGTLRVKTLLSNRRPGVADHQIWEEKADQLRIYSGVKFQAVDVAEAGTVCAVTGLSRTRPGEGLGAEAASDTPSLEPVLTYRVDLPEGCEPHTALGKLRELEEEDPQLHLLWNEQLREIHVQLMGEIQLEILEQLMAQRFGITVRFGAGSIVYRETIAAPVEGVGHFEPLRHYAEAHILLEPLPRGSGLCVAVNCPEDQLDRNWQRLILTHLEERAHLGVLTGSPITDMKLTLVAGCAHVKHTEGGDFRQATYRAVRQGLMQAQSVLLEPWYDFRLEVPSECVGRAMSDIQRMSGTTQLPETVGDEAVLTGQAPVAGLRDYAREVTAYTRGRGRIFCTLRGYEPCHNADEVVAASGYDPERDLDHTPDSVFCAHGAGFTVKWDQVRAHMHVDSGLRLDVSEEKSTEVRTERRAAYIGSIEQDKELKEIFERTYGTIQRRPYQAMERPRDEGSGEKQIIAVRDERPEYLLVDGYNIIFAWDELKAVAKDNLDAARRLLMDLLSNYQGFRKCRVILVFDAYKVPRGVGEVSRYHNIHVVYTKEAETADAYIEKTTYQLARQYRVRVATSDGPEQLIILGHGALRLSASNFREEMEQVEGQIADVLARNNRRERTAPLRQAMEKAKQEKITEENLGQNVD